LHEVFTLAVILRLPQLVRETVSAAVLLKIGVKALLQGAYFARGVFCRSELTVLARGMVTNVV